MHAAAHPPVSERSPTRRAALGAVAGAVICPTLQAAQPPDRKAVHDAARRAVRCLGSIAVHGGWVWRERIDGSVREGERPAQAEEIWVQPPGTPAVGSALVSLNLASGDPDALQLATEAGLALAAGQLASGGWEYSIDFDRERFRTVPRFGETRGARQRRPDSTLDDDTTQSAIRFLLALADALGPTDTPAAGTIRAARDRALAALLAAQLPCGAWPQRYDGSPVAPGAFPPIAASIPADWPRESPHPDYKRYATLNDDTLRDCVALLLDAHRRLGREDCRVAALRAGEFLIRAQLPEPQPAWAQQYDERIQPAWARAFEPPAVTAGESAGAVRTLLELYVETGDERFLEPIPRAIAWWTRSEIAPGTWARYYELGTNEPIYGDRDGRIHRRLDDVSRERREGYAWQGSFGVADTIRAYQKLRDGGRGKALAERGPPNAKSRAKRAAELAPKVGAAIAALDGEGRWVSPASARDGVRAGDHLDMKTYVANLGVMSGFLAASAG